MKSLVFLFAALAVSAVHSAVLWKGDFERAKGVGNATKANIKDYTRMQRSRADQVQIVTTPARQGRYAVRVFLDDPPAVPLFKGRERAELVFSPNNVGIGRHGSTRWLAWSVYIPKDGEFRANDYFRGAGWQTVSQLFNANGSASFHLRPTSSNQWIFTLYGGIGAAKKRDWIFGDLRKGVWHDFLLKMTFSIRDGGRQVQTLLQHRSGGGAFSVVVSDAGPNVASQNSNRHDDVYYFKAGLYRDSRVNGYQSIYVDGPWVGETQSDVTRFFKN